MSRIEKAISSFKGDFNCAQSILSTYGIQYGLNRDTALKLATGFGGGMARFGRTCGAVSAAFMVIGLKYGMGINGDTEVKEKTYQLIREFSDQFQGINGTVIWHEWILDTAKLLKEKRIKTVLVTNGYSTPEASKELIDVGIDAANIDIKAMSDDFYKKICGVKSVKPVLDTAKYFKNNGMHVEITNLIIPDLNDSKEDILKLCKWIVDNLGKDTPTHFSAYHPDFKAPSKKRTSYETLDLAYKIAKDVGLYFPYVGNINHEQGSNTYCPNCGYLLFERRGYRPILTILTLK
ncbi:unnamed protein product [marine sediment metagenome]|uniref:Radical SAM core domain-containing protein n=1 Tax=marine sediment metagenome TaxID=412755 RepID=X1FSM7_9ZZZZ